MEDILISWYKDVFSTSPIGEISLLQAFDRIRNGITANLIEQIRALPEKSERDNLKSQLPCMTFAGTFSYRSNENLIQASGLACLDFDHVNSPAAFRDYIFKNNDFILAAWISPSGDGVKALARIIEVKNDIEYKQIYTALIQV